VRTAVFILGTAWLAVFAGCGDKQGPAEPAEERAGTLLKEAEALTEAPPAEEDAALTKRKRANEAAAHASLRVIATAQAQYRRRSEKGRYCSLEELGRQDLIIGELAAASTPERARNGYYCKLTPGEFDWSCTALPAQPGVSGDYSYYVDQSGTIRRAPCKNASDKPAGPESAALN
jgi:hypothetical protein